MMASTDEFFDVLSIGKTGMGKSTNGNKLIGTTLTPKPTLRRWFAPKSKLLHVPGEERHAAAQAYEASCFSIPTHHPFRSAGEEEYESITKDLELLSSNRVISGGRRIRVMDCPGFGDSDRKGKSVHEDDLFIVRKILIATEELNIRFSRVLFYLPHRGRAEKADGNLQEQVAATHHYFGKAIFTRMFVVATQLDDGHLTDQNVEKTRAVFTKVLEKCDLTDVQAPPVIVLNQIATADEVCEKVVENGTATPFALEFNKETCIKCSLPMKLSVETGKALCTDDMSQQATKREHRDPKKCHPDFILRYNTLTKVVGGFAHLATLGIPYAVGSVLTGEAPWPSFGNSEEECINCRQKPGSPGCMAVDSCHRSKNSTSGRQESRIVSHTCQLGPCVVMETVSAADPEWEQV